MIPLKLTIEGLYSYQHKQVIDFRPLTSAGLFGIFGQVGSGKSTILEAITFALYGETERMHSKNDRNYNMMNLKSNNLLIEFIFSTGNTENEYMATVTSRRNSKKFEEVKVFERKAYKKTDNNEWQPIELQEIENIIGLNYNNFKRTIIIPQGKFQEFLELSGKEKNTMLKELFNLGKYELSGKISSLETKNNEIKSNIEGQLHQIGEVNPEKIDELKADHNKKIKDAETSGKELEIIRLEEEKLKQLKELNDKKIKIKSQLDELLLKTNEISNTEKTLKEYEYCLIYFKSHVGAQKDSNQKIVELKNLLETDKNSLTELIKELEKNKKTEQELKLVYNKKEQLLKESEEYKKIAQIITLEKESTALELRITKGKEILTTCNDNIIVIQNQLKISRDKLKELKDKLPDLNELSKIREWHTKNQQFIKARETLIIESAEITTHKSEILQEIDKLYKTEICKGIDTRLIPGDNIEQLEKIIKVIITKIKQLENEIEEYIIKSKLEQYASNLEDGKPCPLCGAKEHPDVLNIENVSEALTLAKKQKAGFENEINEIQEVIKKLMTIDQQLKNYINSEESNKKKLDNLIIEQKKHSETFKWDKYKNTEELEKAFENADQIKNDISAIEKNIEDLIHKLDNEYINKDKYKNALDEIIKEKLEKDNTIKLLSSQIEISSDVKNNFTEPDAALKIAEEKLKKYNFVTQQYEKLAETISNLQKNADVLKGKTDTNTIVLKKEITEFEKLSKHIEEQLKASSWDNIDDIKNILSQNINIEETRITINEFFKEKESLETLYKDLVSQEGKQKYDQEKHEKLISGITLLTENINKLNREAGGLLEAINKTESNLAKQKELQNNFAKLQQRGENIKLLKNLFKGSKFVNFVSSVHLQNLCKTANERFFNMTRQRLSLEIKEDNNFQIRDFLNNGKVRHIKTLSGGQTFQAALSLALALADNINKMQNNKENFFFLDEGFGTLDKESLDTVFSTLKSLRKENRIVGVISHVEEMQHEMGAYLKIINEETSGSIIISNLQ